MALYTVTDTDLTSIADAIREKGGTSVPLSFPAGFTDAIGAIQTGGGSGSRKNLVFIDYDGTEVSSYTTAEALSLSSLPANPTHTGLTAQGWNWSLANIKSYLTDYPDATVNVGQMYITDDGKTRIYITLDDPDNLSPYLVIRVYNGQAIIDWGDGTEPDTLSHVDSSEKNIQHFYNAVGDYIITIEPIDSTIDLFSPSSNVPGLLRIKEQTGSYQEMASVVYSSKITKVEIGSYVPNISSYAFNKMPNLKFVTIPDSVISIAYYAFQNCYSLQSVTIPDSVTSIGANMFNNCYSLQSATIPDSVTSINNSIFYNCYSLQSATIPDGITSIGGSTFCNCYSLQSVTIPDGVTIIGGSTFNGCCLLASMAIPDGVTDIGGSTFNGCRLLASIAIPDSVTSIGTYAFSNCCSLVSIAIPDSVTSIGNNAFASCFALTSVAIPDSVTSIGNNVFSECNSLVSVTIPDSVTSIGTYAFSNCYCLSEYHFKSLVPPSLANVNAFNSINSTAIIYVPYSSDHSILEAYKTATNWSLYASYMQEEPQT